MKTLPTHIRAAIENYIPSMEGWTTPERAVEMASCILETRASVCVDIGVFSGRSTIAMGFAARELGDSMVFGIDPWKADYAIEGESDRESSEWWQLRSNLEDMHRQTMQAIWAHRLDPWITIIRAASQHVATLFPIIDFLNIDGQHAEVASVRDVTLYLPRVRSGGFVCMDDTDWPQTRKAVSMVEEGCELVSDNGKARTYRKK